MEGDGALRDGSSSSRSQADQQSDQSYVRQQLDCIYEQMVCILRDALIKASSLTQATIPLSPFCHALAQLAA